MTQLVKINPERNRFYCWRHRRWVTVKKLSYCFSQRCRRMYEPGWVKARPGLAAAKGM